MMLGTSTIVWTCADILIMVMGLKITNVWTPDVIENGTQVKQFTITNIYDKG